MDSCDTLPIVFYFNFTFDKEKTFKFWLMYKTILITMLDDKNSS